MSAGSYPPPVRLVRQEHGEPRVISNGVLGMSLFVLTEIMLFAGMVSAFTIVRASAAIWPPPDQPRLPFEETAFNTAALFLSGVFLFVAQRRFTVDRRSARMPLLAAIGLGGFFVVFQGWEWVSMIAQGLTMTSSILGSFFYLIVGTHALHAIVAIGLLVQSLRRLQGGWLQPSQLATAAVLWYFVVGAWPMIYWRVYL
ncbi:MAG TPA: heme-copper oxidase subunit III [Deltaproteobacteria bacterium]|nr:heme-copper oxidase subunit III [Deltaproteobacteria bacterium]